MEVNSTLIAVGVIVILAFVYFIIKRNKKDQKIMEKELNENEVKPDKHDSEQI